MSVRALWLCLVLALPVAASAEETRRPFSLPVSFETSDGFTLKGDLTSSADANAPVAILLHMYRSNRSAWAPLVPELAAAGFTVLAIDQRAHGESKQRRGERVDVAAIPRADFGKLVRDGVRDVKAAARYLARQGLATDRIVLIGASYGCSVSLLSAKQVEGVRALVLLSPGTNYFGVDVLAAASSFPGPLLVVAAEDDRQAVESARIVAARHRGGSRRPRDLPLRWTRNPPVRPAATAEAAHRRVCGQGRGAGGLPAVKRSPFQAGPGSR